MKEEDLRARVDKLREGIKTGRLKKRKRILRTLNQIDRILQDILMSGEKILHPKQHGTWSQELMRVKCERKYWRWILHRRKKGSHERMTRIWKGHQQCNLQLSVADMLAHLEKADENVREVYRKKYTRREKFLVELASEAGEKGEEEREKAIKEINKREKRNREFGYLRNVLKPRREDVVPEVEVPKGEDMVEEMWETLKERRENPDEWVTITGREKVEHLLIEWNKIHFNQAAETPLANGQWERRLNIRDRKNDVQTILESGAKELDIDVQECVEWIEELK